MRPRLRGKTSSSLAALAALMLAPSCTEERGSVAATDGNLGATSATTAARPSPTAAMVTPARAPGAKADERLRNAATAGNADAVRAAVREGANLEARDEQGRTALLLAAKNDRADVARVLIELGANPDALDEQHDTPWLVTGETGSVEMAEILLEAEPDLTIRNRFGGVSIIPASERGHVAYIRRVVATDIDVNHVNDLGWTALLEAVILGDGSTRYQQIVRILLDAGADANLADREGVTALAHARSRGQTEVARLLESAGPNT